MAARLCIIAVFAASAAVHAAPTLEFRDSQDPYDAGVTLVHDPADPAAANALVCSGEFHAADVRINGTNTTMAQIIKKVGTLESEARELTQRLSLLASIESDVQMLKVHYGLIPSPPPPPPPPHNYNGCFFMPQSGTDAQKAAAGLYHATNARVDSFTSFSDVLAMCEVGAIAIWRARAGM